MNIYIPQFEMKSTVHRDRILKKGTPDCQLL
jgi:hypothetical protein